MKINNTTKRYLISSAITFTAVFLTIIVNNIDKVNVDTINTGLIAGIVLTALRGGLKAMFENIITMINK